MNFDVWSVDLGSASAIHPSGFKIVVEGELTNPSGVHPGRFPEGLTALEQARLLRCGLEAIMKKAQEQNLGKKHNPFSGRQSNADGNASVDSGYKPTRPVLSLKKS